MVESEESEEEQEIEGLVERDEASEEPDEDEGESEQDEVRGPPNESSDTVQTATMKFNRKRNRQP